MPVATSLREAFAKIVRVHGEGSIMRLGDVPHKAMPVISTGVASLDVALGIGGLPRGRIVEIFGPESTGKTTLALSVIAQAQRAGGNAAFIDVEHALDRQWAEVIGVDTDNLIVSQPDCGEDAISIVRSLADTGEVAVIVVDSVAALVPKAEIQGEMGDANVGAHPRLMSKAMRMLSGPVAKSETLLIFINQLREKVGVMYGPTETTTGGRALRFYTSVRIDLRRKEFIKKKDEVIGAEIEAKVAKNKVAPPMKKVRYTIWGTRGIVYESGVLDAAVGLGLVTETSRGGWFSYGDIRLGQGKEAVLNFLAANSDVRDELAERVRLGVTPAPEINTPESPLDDDAVDLEL